MHSTSSQAGVRSTSSCPCPLSPRDIRVQLSPRQRGPIGEVRAVAVSFAPLWLEIPFEIGLSQLLPTGGPEVLDTGTPLRLSPPLSGAPCPDRVWPALPCYGPLSRAAPGHRGRGSRRGRGGPPAQAGGRGGRAKKWFCIAYPSFLMLVQSLVKWATSPAGGA